MKDNWKKMPIGEVCKSYAGGTPNRSNPTYYGGEIPWISSGEVNQAYITDTKEKITKEGLRFSSAKMIPKEAILLAMYGATAGQVSKLKIDATANQAVLALIPDDADDYFIYHELNFIKNRILFLAQGSGQPNLSKSLIDQTLIDCPPLPQQRKIANILSTCDEVIEKTEAAIAKYQALKQGMMHDLFTSGIDVKTGKLRPSYQDAPELYKESELGMIPKDWDVSELETFTNYVDYRGKTPPKADKGIFLITAKNIKFGFIDYEISKEYIPTAAYKTAMSRGISEIGDVLITTEAPMGNVAQINIEGLALAQRVIKYRCYPNEMLNDFLKHSMMAEYFQKELEAESTGSTVKGIKGSRLHLLNVMKPSILEQEKIVHGLAPVEAKIEAEQSALAKYQQIKAGLMQDLLTGNVEVSVAEEILKN
tara:strand:- start:5985 stop:7253 length:1269 start_codon:yes stop_codon:yes gene_type:complete